MFQSLLKWLGPWLLQQLVPILDPDAAGRAAASLEKIRLAEERETEAAEKQRLSDELARQSEAAYLQSEKQREQWNFLLEESAQKAKVARQEFLESEARVRSIRDETEKLNAAVDDRTDDELFFSGVPKPNTGSK